MILELVILLVKIYLVFTVAVLLIFVARHYTFTLTRVFRFSREAYQDWACMATPPVTVLVPMHNEERVCLGVLEALERSSFDKTKLQVIPVNDRSTDRTAEIIDAFAAKHPWCQPFHRKEGKGGKAAALKDVMPLVKGDVVILFDADYLPGVGLLDSLVAPFMDPEIGLVMGRVVPSNGAHNLLTRLLEIERCGGYQTNQQARWRLGLVPQFGGTVGGIRRMALEAAGGWDEGMLAEDTDLTYRLLALGWKVAYINRAECYEEVVETWTDRRKQLRRWAMGHMQACLRHAWTLLRNPDLGHWEKIDGFLLLCVYFVPPLTFLAWLASAFLLMVRPDLFPSAVVVMLAVITFFSIGNFGTFYEISVALALDGVGKRQRLLPFLGGTYIASLFLVSEAVLKLAWSRIKGESHIAWDKTPRYRR
ncbi:MAG: glycosyltransferase family 2 protein [Holophagaceae bacterium]|nr:glycosyltransferase family 2 protein [Holophagaceae bacterium]